MSALDTVDAFRRNVFPFRRRVSISRDGADFIVAFQPDNIVVFRHPEASKLRKLCHSLRWEIVSDALPDTSDLASW